MRDMASRDRLAKFPSAPEALEYIRSDLPAGNCHLQAALRTFDLLQDVALVTRQANADEIVRRAPGWLNRTAAPCRVALSRVFGEEPFATGFKAIRETTPIFSTI